MTKAHKLTEINKKTRLLLSGNEAIALGAREAGVYIGAAYPGTSA